MSSKFSTPPHLVQLMGSEKYSDLKFVCQGQEFKVHKAIVCTQSPVLAAACDGSFQEAATNSINIDEFEAATVKRMIEFMYTKEYDDGMEKRGSEDVDSSNLPASTHVDSLCAITPAMTTEMVLHHVRVNAIADYYDIPLLKQLANTKIQRLLETTRSADGFSDVVREVFNSTSDKALREIMASTAATHIEELIGLEDFTALDVMSEFAVSIIQNTSRQLQAVKSQLQQTESRLRSAEQDCSYEKSLRESETAKADRIVAKINDCLDTLSKTRTCRNVNCSADFTCYIERGGFLDEPKYTLRCARCQCRHKSI
ncbi:hypothetical protein BKA65DRAFT_466379 [Rhexocercosporidium sp. MPI-PUGE-AT-0058]|nr:hypothetical protein BKA65DRAFT_466379 [Rhexocercosporidium sp. MPI-PUGE-AT-0058]